MTSLPSASCTSALVFLNRDSFSDGLDSLSIEAPGREPHTSRVVSALSRKLIRYPRYTDASTSPPALHPPPQQRLELTAVHTPHTHSVQEQLEAFRAVSPSGRHCLFESGYISGTYSTFVSIVRQLKQPARINQWTPRDLYTNIGRARYRTEDVG